MRIAKDFQAIHTNKKSFESWRDPPIRNTLASNDTIDTTKAGPRKSKDWTINFYVVDCEINFKVTLQRPIARTTDAQWSLFSLKSRTVGLEQTNWAFGVFLAKLSAPILVKEGPLDVLWQVSFGYWVTWSISRWQKYFCCSDWSLVYANLSDTCCFLDVGMGSMKSVWLELILRIC